MTEAKTHLYVIKPVKPYFINDITQEEQEIMANHFKYLEKLRDEDVLILAGPRTDGVLGIVLFRAPSYNSAKKVMENDPAIIEGLMKGELHPFRLSLVGNLISEDK
jgi:uncharacterized protein YciI